MTPCGYPVTTPFGISAPEWGTNVFGEDPTPIQVRLGLASDPATSMVVTWRTRDDTTLAGVVEYGAGDALDQRAQALTWVYYPYAAGPTRIHEAHLCGLAPDTSYSYRVGAGGAFSPVTRFRTAPPPGADVEVVVGVLGDSRDGWDTWRSLLEVLESIAAPDLLLTTGDAVNSGLDQGEWNGFLDGTELLARVPVVMVHGNHEANDPIYVAQFALPGDEKTFALDYGAMHLTVVNDWPPAPEDIAGSIARFLDDDLSRAPAGAWKVVSHHRPIWSAAHFHGSAAELQKAWIPILDAHAVDLVLNGHDHNYERSFPMRGLSRAPAGEGTVYVVSGGAGASLYENGTDFFTAVSASVHHVVVVRVRPGLLRLSSYAVDGSLIDELALPPR